MPEFADEIIIALVSHASNQDYSLALSYYYTVQPALKTSSALEHLFEAIAQTNLSEGLLFSRSCPEHTRELLFQRLIASVLDRNGPNERLNELALLSLDQAEEAWLEDYLANGQGKDFKKAKDTLLIRKIASDQFAEVSKIRTGGSWATILQGIKGGIEGHSE